MISVIVPIYNVEKYLEKCIVSILNQTYKDIEIILVNDGSTDNCLDICNHYAQKDSRILVIDKVNGGLSSARNAGLDISKGDYISFIDSDDWIEKNFLESLIKVILECNCEIAQCNFIKEEEGKETDIDNDSYSTNDIKVLSNKEALKNLYNKNYLNSVVFWNKLYKKEVFKNLRFKNGIINEDEDLIYKVLYEINNIGIIDKNLYHYLIRTDSIMGKKFNQKNLDIINIIEERIAFFKEKEEKELEKLTYKTYFRILIGLGSKVYYSDLEEKDSIMHTIISKIDTNFDIFYSNKYKDSVSKILLISYKINIKSSFFMNKLISNIKVFLKKSR